MSLANNILIKRCDRWKKSLAYFLSLKLTHSNIENICHSSTYLISWLNDLRDCDEKVYESYLSNVRHYLNMSSEVVFNYFFSRCKLTIPKSPRYSTRYVKAVGELIDHVYYTLWCSYYSENEEFVDRVYSAFLNDIIRNLPPTSNLKGRNGKRVGKAMWELLMYFEKLLDYDTPLWAIQKFQTKDLIKPKINQEETYKIMSALDQIELSNPPLVSDLQYRLLRNELLTSVEYASRERRKILKGSKNARCICGALLDSSGLNVEYNINGERLILLAKVSCSKCGKLFSIRSPVDKTKRELDQLEQMDEYLNTNYNISLIKRMKGNYLT
jgi:hypothetical protein